MATGCDGMRCLGLRSLPGRVITERADDPRRSKRTAWYLAKRGKYKQAHCQFCWCSCGERNYASPLFGFGGRPGYAATSIVAVVAARRLGWLKRQPTINMETKHSPLIGHR